MITNRLESFFDLRKDLSLKDNFSNYRCSFTTNLNIKKINSLDKNEYTIFNNYLNEYGYDWTLEIQELNYTISQAVFETVNLAGFEEGDLINVVCSIFKKGNKVVIFDETKFYEYLDSENLHSLLLQFKNKSNGIIFYQPNCAFKSSNHFLGFNQDLKNVKDDGTIISSQCTFNNFSDFKFTPDEFYLFDNPKDNPLLLLFEKLHFIFLIIYMFDSTEITKNQFKTKLSGYITLKHELNFKKLDISSVKVYRNIYRWIYSEVNKIEDKIGITRNILSMYIDEKDLDIKMDAYSSILSANETYIKGNINKYIEIRNKVHEQLEQLSNRVNGSLEAFYSNFQKTIFVFISFYLSIFVIRTYAKIDVEDIFNKQLTYMALGLLGLSFVFMIFSNWILNLEKKRIKAKYDDVKERASDVLVSQDIEKLLKDDKEYKSEIKFLNKRRVLYIVLWVLTLFIFGFVLAYTSNHI